jgi:hypothetical protein
MIFYLLPPVSEWQVVFAMGENRSIPYLLRRGDRPRPANMSRYFWDDNGIFRAFSKKLSISTACCRLHSALGVRFTHAA